MNDEEYMKLAGSLWDDEGETEEDFDIFAEQKPCPDTCRPECGCEGVELFCPCGMVLTPELIEKLKKSPPHPTLIPEEEWHERFPGKPWPGFPG